MKLLKAINRPDLQGKQVYPNWRLDKNLSWFNIEGTIFGLIYSLVTFEVFRDFKMFKQRFNTGKIWLPPVYAKDYKQYIYE